MKSSKWATKTLESVHRYEFGNIEKISSAIHEDGGVVDNSTLGDVEYMDVSYDCELNLSSNLEPTFENDITCDEWKESMQNEYDAFMKNGT